MSHVYLYEVCCYITVSTYIHQAVVPHWLQGAGGREISSTSVITTDG